MPCHDVSVCRLNVNARQCCSKNWWESTKFPGTSQFCGKPKFQPDFMGDKAENLKLPVRVECPNPVPTK
uniref:Uncharacterized protein n=1 Tax=Oryza punctata TaxID=4537 RepID=A0A0E0L7G5_ORYPU